MLGLFYLCGCGVFSDLSLPVNLGTVSVSKLLFLTGILCVMSAIGQVLKMQGKG